MSRNILLERWNALKMQATQCSVVCNVVPLFWIELHRESITLEWSNTCSPKSPKPSHAIKGLKESTLHKQCTEPVPGEYRDATQTSETFVVAQLSDEIVPLSVAAVTGAHRFGRQSASHMLRVCVCVCVCVCYLSCHKNATNQKRRSNQHQITGCRQSIRTTTLRQSVNLQSVSDSQNY